MPWRLHRYGGKEDNSSLRIPGRLDGEWGETYFDFEKVRQKTLWLSDWDTTKSRMARISKEEYTKYGSRLFDVYHRNKSMISFA